MRLPYAPAEPAESAESSTRETYNRIASRRHPRPLIPLDLTLLHSPVVADGYNAFVGAIRNGTSLPPAMLELAVCRVAVLTNAVWEWEAHSKLAVKAGVGRRAMELVLNEGRDAFARLANPEEKGDLDEVQRAVLNYTDRVTLDNNVGDATWGALQTAFQNKGWLEKELVELTVAIAGYNAVSRILVPLDVGERNGLEMRIPDEAR